MNYFEMHTIVLKYGRMPEYSKYNIQKNSLGEEEKVWPEKMGRGPL